MTMDAAAPVSVSWHTIAELADGRGRFVNFVLWFNNNNINQALPPPTRLAGPLRRDLLRVSSGLGLGSGVHFSLSDTRTQVGPTPLWRTHLQQV